MLRELNTPLMGEQLVWRLNAPYPPCSVEQVGCVPGTRAPYRASVYNVKLGGVIPWNKLLGWRMLYFL